MRQKPSSTLAMRFVRVCTLQEPRKRRLSEMKYSLLSRDYSRNIPRDEAKHPRMNEVFTVQRTITLQYCNTHCTMHISALLVQLTFFLTNETAREGPRKPKRAQKLRKDMYR